MTHDDLMAYARTIIAANSYLTLGTSDMNGHPWTSPVYFAAGSLRQYYWQSATDARHSRNLVERGSEHRHLRLHGRAVSRTRRVRSWCGQRTVG